MDPTGSGGNNTGGNNTGGDNMNTTGTDGGYRRIIYTGPFPYAPRNKWTTLMGVAEILRDTYIYKPEPFPSQGPLHAIHVKGNYTECWPDVLVHYLNPDVRPTWVIIP